MGSYDILGDVHGMAATLAATLDELGYLHGGNGWSHPVGRRLLCVGDVLDCGPDPLGCLETLQAMAQDGVATLVLGNHELNTLHFEDGLRSPEPSHLEQARSTRAQMEADPGRWKAARAWLETCPLHVALDGGRVAIVHACWDPEALDQLPASLSDDDALKRTAPDGDLRKAVEMVMKGPLEDCEAFKDSRGVERTTRQVTWWEEHSTAAPFVAFGHYRFPWPGNPSTPVRPNFLGLGKNVVCLDYGVDSGGPMVAVRYPERELVSIPNADG